MVSAYFQDCRYCGRRIQLRPMPGGQWTAWEGADKLHDCRGLNTPPTPQPAIVPEAIQDPVEPVPVAEAAGQPDEPAEPEQPAPPRPRAIFGPLPERVEPRRTVSRPAPPQQPPPDTAVALAPTAVADPELQDIEVEEGVEEVQQVVPRRNEAYLEPRRVRRKGRLGTITLAFLTIVAALVAGTYLTLVGINSWIAGSAWAALPENDHWYCWSAGIPMPHEVTGASDERLCTEGQIKDVRNFLWPRVLPDPWD